MMVSSKIRIIHISGEANTNPKKKGLTGGLNRFLEELISVQKQSSKVRLISVPNTILNSSSDYVKENHWSEIAKLGKMVLGNKSADIYHGHDWYCEPVFEYLFRQGVRSLVMTSHLPIRRGFTYRDSGASWHSKALMENRAMQAAIKITTPSVYVSEFLQDEYGISPQQLVVIPHGVSKSFYSNLKLPLDFTKHKFIIVGRITEQKGIELVIRAYPYLLKRFPNSELIIAGEGSRQTAIERLVAQFKLKRYVKFPGYLGKEKLRRILSQSTLMFMPSQFEPFGLVGLEAMASGCPVFSIRPSGAETYLKPWELTDNYSPPRLAKDIIKFLLSLESKKLTRSHFQNRAKDFTWEKSSRNYYEVYKKVLNSAS